VEKMFPNWELRNYFGFPSNLVPSTPVPAATARPVFYGTPKDNSGWQGLSTIPFFRGGMRSRQEAVTTINRALVTLRHFFGWLVEEGHVPASPAKPVKELRRQLLAPKGMDRSQVRRLLREVELRQDIRAGAIFSLFLYTGCRVGDLVALELHDLMLSERSGSVVFRLGKGNKQSSVPLPLPARRALQAYLETRPPVQSSRLFIGERGALRCLNPRTR
jgi:site-specific recombinase XerC